MPLSLSVSCSGRLLPRRLLSKKVGNYDSRQHTNTLVRTQCLATDLQKAHQPAWPSPCDTHRHRSSLLLPRWCRDAERDGRETDANEPLSSRDASPRQSDDKVPGVALWREANATRRWRPSGRRPVRLARHNNNPRRQRQEEVGTGQSPFHPHGRADRQTGPSARRERREFAAAPLQFVPLEPTSRPSQVTWTAAPAV